MNKPFFINNADMNNSINSITENIPNKMLATRHFVVSVNGGEDV